jgi:subtilisin family serine protease
MFADSCGCDVFSISIVPRLLYGDSIFLDNLNEDIERFIDTTDMIIVTAAGNEGIPYMGAIAMHPKVVSVVALDIDNKMSFYSNYSKDKISFGGYVDNGIFTYDLPGKQGENSSDYIVDFAGTSASCAMIAGAIGLAKSNGLSIDKITDTIFVRDSIIVKVLKF